jgi:hypothetical protein
MFIMPPDNLCELFLSRRHSTEHASRCTIPLSGCQPLKPLNLPLFTVEKRTIPTIVMTNNSVIAGFNAATCQVAVAGTRGIRGNATATGTVGARYFFLHFTADAEL